MLNHCGGPIGSGAYQGKRDEVFPKWQASIKALAAHPNVFVKVGGLGQAINGIGLNQLPEPPSSEVLANTFRPCVETCIEAFGASRCMFESNFPVDKVSYSYPVFWNACKLLAKNASQSEKAGLFSGTAARFYGLTGVVMAQWLKEGRLHYREYIVDGLEQLPNALIALLNGANTGKLVVKAGWMTAAK